MKEAAKMTAMLGAMGVEGAEEAGNIIRLGRRATADQQQRLQEILGNAQDTFAGVQQAGLGVEMTFGTMMEKLNLEQYFGPDSPFSTALTKGVAVTEESLKNMETLSTATDETSEVIRVVNQSIQKFGNAIDRTLIGDFAQSFAGAGVLATTFMGDLNKNTGRWADASDAAFGNMTNITGELSRVFKGIDFEEKMEEWKPANIAKTVLGKVGINVDAIRETIQNIDNTISKFFGRFEKKYTPEQQEAIKKTEDFHAQRKAQQILGKLETHLETIATEGKATREVMEKGQVPAATQTQVMETTMKNANKGLKDSLDKMVDLLGKAEADKLLQSTLSKQQYNQMLLHGNRAGQPTN